MFKLLYNCTYFTCEQGNTQNPSSQASAEHELRTFRCTKWIQKMQSSQRLNCQHLLNNRKSKEIPKQIYFCFTDCTKAFDCVDPNKLWIVPKEMGVPDHLTCVLRNLYADQEKTVRIRHETSDWFKIGKGVHQGCIQSPCIFNFYAKYILRSAGLNEPQGGIKIAGRNINNLRYADDTTLMVESEESLFTKEPFDESERGE